MRNTIIQAAVASLAALISAAPASAELMVSYNVGGITATCVDNNSACDTNSTVGILQLADQTINGVSVNGQISASTKGGDNTITTSSLSVINNNTTPVDITFTVGDTDFLGPINQFFVSGSGTFNGAVTGSTVTYQWLNDPSNAQGAETFNDLPGNVLDTFTATQTLARSQSFSFDDSGATTDGALFSMTLTASGTLQPSASLLSRGESEIKPQLAVSEPGSLALLAAALLGFVGLRRRVGSAVS
jgi:hypothetical protein